MGGREAGGLAHLLPGYRQVTNPRHRQEVEDFWGLPRGRISPRPGRAAWQIVEGLERGEIGLLWIAATNPVVSFPHLGRARAAFLKSPFTVYQEAYFPTETAAIAHLILPAAQWGEKTGVMTNSERRVTLVPAFRLPPERLARIGRFLPKWDGDWGTNSCLTLRMPPQSMPNLSNSLRGGHVISPA